MRGLTSAALLLAPALAAVAVPPVPDLSESNPTVFVTFDVPDAAKAANYVTLRFDVLESDQPCGPASLKINDQPLPQSDDADHGTGSGTFVLGPGSTMAARWNLTCLADEQLLDFSVDLVDGAAVPDATFALRFVQTAPVAVLDAEGPAVRVSLGPPISPDAVAKGGCSGDDGDDLPAELDEMHLRKMEMHAALRELDFLRAALADLTALVAEKERFVAVEFGKDAKLHKGGIAQCDSIKCVVGNVVGKVAGAASFVYGELVGSGSGPGRHHRRPPHHRHFFPWPPRHGNHSHPHPPGGNHTHGNHSWPHPPFRPPHWLPPCHCPPPHHPPPHHPPPHHPPPHHKPPHHPPPDGPPEGPPEGPPDGPPPPFDGPPPPPPHHGGPPPPPPDFDGPPPPPDFDGPPPPPGFPPPPLGFPPPPPGFPPPPPPGFPPPPPPFDGPPPPPPHGREGFFPPPPGMDERPMIGDDHRWSRPRPGPGGGPPRGHHGPPPFRAHIHRLLILAAVVFLAASLLGMLHRRFCGGARRLTREDRRTLRAARRTAWHRRRDARRAKWASRRARLAALCGRLFGLGDSAADDEEKEAMLRARSSSTSSVDGSVIESDLTQLRNAADVVGSLVAAEEGRVARREQLRLEGGGVIVGLAEAVRSAPVPMPPPSPMSSFPDYVSVDEALPSYEGVSLASSVESSVVADGYRPGARVYTPSDSSEGSGVDDVLGRSPPKE